MTKKSRTMYSKMFAVNVFLALSNVVDKVSSLQCSDVLQNSDEKIWSTEELYTMNPEDISECIQQLGKIKLPLRQAKIIWDSLITFYGGAGLIPEEKLNTLHWVTIAVESEDYLNMTISNIDVVENFGFFYDLSKEQLTAIADRVREDFGGKDPEDYTSYDLIALRQIVCAFNPDEIKRIHPMAYKDAAVALGSLKKCPNEVLRALAQLAIQPKAFGLPDTWNEEIIDSIGIVINGLTHEMIDLLPRTILGIDSSTKQEYKNKD